MAYDVVPSFSVLASEVPLNTSISNITIVNGDDCFVRGLVQFIIASSEEYQQSYSPGLSPSPRPRHSVLREIYSAMLNILFSLVLNRSLMLWQFLMTT